MQPEEAARSETNNISILDDQYIKNSESQRRQSDKLLNAFYRLNAAAFGLILLFYAGDWFQWAFKTGMPPLITSNVVIAMVGASAVQLGALVLKVGPDIFKPPVYISSKRDSSK